MSADYGVVDRGTGSSALAQPIKDTLEAAHGPSSTKQKSRSPIPNTPGCGPLFIDNPYHRPGAASSSELQRSPSLHQCYSVS